MPAPLCVYIGDNLARYGFGEGHPFGPDRLGAFWQQACAVGLDRQVQQCVPVSVERALIERFHTAAYVDRVIQQSASGEGYLDGGDTPARKGIYESACYVVGSVLDAIERILARDCGQAFVPIAGLHHARRDSAAGFLCLQRLRHRHRDTAQPASPAAYCLRRYRCAPWRRGVLQL